MRKCSWWLSQFFFLSSLSSWYAHCIVVAVAGILSPTTVGDNDRHVDAYHHTSFYFSFYAYLMNIIHSLCVGRSSSALSAANSCFSFATAKSCLSHNPIKTNRYDDHIHTIIQTKNGHHSGLSNCFAALLSSHFIISLCIDSRHVDMPKIRNKKKSKFHCQSTSDR